MDYFQTKIGNIDMMKRAEEVISLWAVFLVILLAWGVNFYRLTQCDFENNYRCEVIHGIGLIPMSSPFTVWFAADTGENL